MEGSFKAQCHSESICWCSWLWQACPSLSQVVISQRVAGREHLGSQPSFLTLSAASSPGLNVLPWIRGLFPVQSKPQTLEQADPAQVSTGTIAQGGSKVCMD
jgi:hypothetical protein